MSIALRQLAGRVVVPGAIAAALVVAALAYAYFYRSASGTGIQPVASFNAPALSPAGAPDFDETHLLPGDSASRSVTVTAPGGPPSQIGLYEQSLTGVLVSDLELRILEDGARLVYDGRLAGGWTASSPLVLPGGGADGSWAPGEQHTFVFVVSLPVNVGNSAQSATASTNFVWLREVG